MESVRRISSTRAVWTFTTPVASIFDVNGLEIANPPTALVSQSADLLQITVDYSGPITVGDAWQLDNGSIMASTTVFFPTQAGRVV